MLAMHPGQWRLSRDAGGAGQSSIDVPPMLLWRQQCSIDVVSRRVPARIRGTSARALPCGRDGSRVPSTVSIK
jgi:hypothetical protein